MANSTPYFNPSNLRMTWWFYCTIGFIVGHLLLGLIGHGFTGPHEGRPTGISAFAHTLALIIGGLSVYLIQRIGLRPWFRITNRRILYSVIIYVTAFQFAAYILRPPFDHFFAMPVLGIALWFSFDSLKLSRIVLLLASLFSFWIGVISSGILIEVVVPLTGYEFDDTILFDHVLSWVIGGGAAGFVGGFFSGWSLSRQLAEQNKNQ